MENLEQELAEPVLVADPESSEVELSSVVSVTESESASLANSAELANAADSMDVVDTTDSAISADTAADIDSANSAESPDSPDATVSAESVASADSDPQQTEQPVVTIDPVAIVAGQAVVDVPQDLYIPPEALKVFLESFQGPLDFLLYLIKRQNIDILDIPVAKITQQYVAYVELMQNLNFELAADYLVMAAMLAEIKSRMLLPRPPSSDEEEIEDPRAELVRRLQEYERFKKAAMDIDDLSWVDRDVFTVKAGSQHIEAPKAEAKVEMKDILVALVKVFERAKLNAHHHIQKEALSLRERMGTVLQTINTETFTEFQDLFDAEEGRAGVVVTFIAILELLRQNMIEMVQAQAFGPIHVKAVKQ